MTTIKITINTGIYFAITVTITINITATGNTIYAML